MCPDCNPECGVCRDAGRIVRRRPTDDPEFGLSEACPECVMPKPGERLDSRDYFARANLPEAYRGYRIDQWLPADGRPRQLVEEWASQGWPRMERPALFLYGPPGRGKTTLMVGAAWLIFQRFGVNARWHNAIELTDRYRSASLNGDGDGESIQSIDAEMRRTPLLLLDEYGLQRATGLAEERMAWLFEQRYAACLPMIVTSNANLADLPDRVKSRMSQGYFVSVDGPDHRIAQGAR